MDTDVKVGQAVKFQTADVVCPAVVESFEPLNVAGGRVVIATITVDRPDGTSRVYHHVLRAKDDTPMNGRWFVT